MNRTHVLLVVTILVALGAAFRGGELRVPFIIERGIERGSLPRPAPQPPVVGEVTRIATVFQVVQPRPKIADSSAVSSSGSLTMRVRPAADAVRLGSDGELYVLVSLEAAKVAATGRLPLNLALVLDRSGSMAARNKLDYAKKAAKIAVSQLTLADRLAIVAFDSVSTVLLPSTPVKDVEAIHALIDSLTPGGSTNLSQGMTDGKAEVLKGFRKDQINRVLVMTDGLANFGETNPAAMGRFARETGEQGISITTLGLGADYQEDLLLNIAEYAGGRYYFIENPEQMSGIYQSEMKGMLQTVARNVRVSLAPGQGVSVDQVHGYRGPADPSRSQCLLGDIFAGQTRKLIVRLKVPALRADTIKPALTVSLTYEDALRSRAVATSLDIATVITSDQAQVDSSVRLDVSEKVESVRAAAKLEEAMVYLDRGQRTEAQRLLLDQARQSRVANYRLYRSANLGQQVTQMENAARALDSLSGSSEAYRNYVKANKFEAYQQSR